MDLTPESRRLVRGLSFLSLGCLLSYIFVTLLGNSESAGVYGAYGLYRLAQGIIVFSLIARVPFTARRLAIVRRTVTCALLFATIGIFLTYFDVIRPADLVAHLPRDLEVAGPWGFYSLVERRGWGTLGYNHSFVAMQVVMLLALLLHLGRSTRDLTAVICIPLAVTAVFLSESRTAFATVLIFTGFVLVTRRAYLIALFVGILIWMANPPQADQRFGPEVLATLTRQTTIINAFEKENLSSRPEIWAERIAYLNEQPTRWLIGSGFGSGLETGENAHMQYLHTIVETGIFGLVAFLLVMRTLLEDLYARTRAPHIMFWILIAFLISAFAQETLYPVAASGPFLVFYLSTLALALQPVAVEPEPAVIPWKNARTARTLEPRRPSARRRMGLANIPRRKAL
jgi:hypothetical protein